MRRGLAGQDMGAEYHKKLITITEKNMDKRFKTMKVWKGTLSKLRFLSGLQERPMTEIIDNSIEINHKDDLKKYKDTKEN